MSTGTNMPIAAVRFPTLNALLIVFARAVYAAFLANAASLPAPTPTLPIFKNDIDALDDAETNAATKAKGTAQVRNVKKKTVKSDLTQLRNYLQTLVLLSGSPEAGAALIVAAFMSVKKTPVRTKAQLAAKHTGVSGVVALIAKALGPSTTYYWQYSLDQKTWLDGADTHQAKTTISGLTPGQLYYFRFSALTRKGPVDVSQIVSLLAQ